MKPDTDTDIERTLSEISKNWVRTALCGWVTGVTWFSISAVTIGFAQGLLPEELTDLIEIGGPHERWNAGIFFGIDLIMGVWAIWLYSIIATKHGPGPKAAAMAGLAWWAMKSLQSAKYAGLGLVPLSLEILFPLVSTLATMILATVVGAWLYEKVELSPVSAPE